jgi:hypothetical protein
MSLSGRTTQAIARGRSASPAGLRLDRPATTRRSRSSNRLMENVVRNASARSGQRRSIKELGAMEGTKPRRRSRSGTRLLLDKRTEVSPRQIEASINQGFVEVECHLGQADTTKRSRRNVSSTLPEKKGMPPRNISNEPKKRRSVRQLAIVENQEATFERTLSRQRRRTPCNAAVGTRESTHQTDKGCSLSPTKDLKTRRQRSSIPKPVVPGNEKQGSASESRLRISLATRKVGEMSENLNGSSSWADASLLSASSTSEGSSSMILEHAQRMKNLSDTYHRSTRQLHQHGKDATAIKSKRLSREIAIFIKLP